MNSPSKYPGNSDFNEDYAPPWARDQIRPIFGHSPSLPVEKRSRNDLTGPLGAFGEDPAWLRRGLEPDVVPEPPVGVTDFWPIVLRLGIVCGIAAAVAAAVVLLLSGKPTVQESVRAKAPPPSIASTSGALSSIESPGIVPAVVDDKSVNAAKTLPEALPPQAPSAEMRAPPAAAEPPPQVIATAPANQSLAKVEPNPAPAANPTPSPPVRDTSPPPQAAPAPASAPASPPVSPTPANRPAVVLDNDEIVRLIKRGKDLLTVGDFAAARLLFERAANAGSSEAALALGSTYDPLFIKKLGAVAVTPDIDKARKWYQFAADRGSSAASLQLANLAHAR
ncbi:MAG TPA: hypothetical protein VEK31_02460 [Xanthobacteraceae bacterium]|nr:hypothetical protein [Xanthobacteraceae bacterium]